MAIRKYDYPRAVDLSQGLQNVLQRNGMQAHITETGKGFQLIVLGHDAPVMKYDLNEKQVRDLMGWGSSYENKKAYNTFTSIVRNDFQIPDNFAAARNAFGRVSLGQHGYRIAPGEYGTPRRGVPFFAPFSRYGRGWGGDFLNWRPRYDGYHLRRIDARAFIPNRGTWVTERPDRTIKPGEIRSGGYGFYYKGKQQETSVEVLDSLKVNTQIKPLEAQPRPKGQAVAYSSVIASDVYFTNDKFQEVLKTHGLVIDMQKSTLTVQSASARADAVYDLTPEELQKLTASNISGENGVTVEERLSTIDRIIGMDFKTPVTKDMLETKDLVNLEMTETGKAEIEKAFIEQDQQIQKQQRLEQQRAEKAAEIQEEKERILRDPTAIDGREIQNILGNKGWFQPVEHGREMYVGEIHVDKTRAGAYVMEAMINGRLVAHTISKKDYQKFMEYDDRHRLELFDKIFDEVKIKSAHGEELYGDELYHSRSQGWTTRQEMDTEHATSNSINGSVLQQYNEKKGFYRERTGGREVEVGKIEVAPKGEGRYEMSAYINGERVAHDITQKQYEKFMAVDDYHRVQLFSKIFNEVDIKTRPEERVNIGAAILAAIVATGEVAADIMSRGSVPPRPEIYETKGVYYKPGIVHPEEVAAMTYNDLEATTGRTMEEGVRRGI